MTSANSSLRPQTADAHRKLTPYFVSMIAMPLLMLGYALLLAKGFALQLSAAMDSLLVGAAAAAVTVAAFSTLTLSLATSKGLRRGITRKLSAQQPYFEGRAMGGIRAQCT
jgi:hypothetical protein